MEEEKNKGKIESDKTNKERRGEAVGIERKTGRKREGDYG